MADTQFHQTPFIVKNIELSLIRRRCLKVSRAFVGTFGIVLLWNISSGDLQELQMPVISNRKPMRIASWMDVAKGSTTSIFLNEKQDPLKRDAENELSMKELMEALDEVEDDELDQPPGTERRAISNPRALAKLREIMSNPASLQQMMLEVQKMMQDPKMMLRLQRILIRVQKVFADPQRMAQLRQNLMRMPGTISSQDDNTAMPHGENTPMPQSQNAGLQLTPEFLQQQVHIAQQVMSNPGMMQQMVDSTNKMMQDPQMMQQMQQMMQDPQWSAYMSSVMGQMTQTSENVDGPPQGSSDGRP
eukprot:gnl/MRDRNA2_/MRDRNA2_80084_c0_seq2.p1 gnl/MRDRNA2_/MRDRNA2_80084_c0~~gnl/MRDRNA2_/MRDRNA2_80084_c0_seq2.p1  ORF type:complete len:303 (-),score=75.98 gnl/MRDRNA2_/MRDRNA2_80084_c0_seq2:166-1074(-)